jgi:macrolide-specific efflux system membrane fusion protein
VPVATVQNGVSTYAVQIEVDPAQARAAGVRNGMTATASIVTASKTDVIVAPNRAIRSAGQTRTVEVVDAEGKSSTRTVQVGLASVQLTEIVSGLQPGDKVAVPAPTTTVSSGAARVPGLTGGPGVTGGAAPGRIP